MQRENLIEKLLQLTQRPNAPLDPAAPKRDNEIRQGGTVVFRKPKEEEARPEEEAKPGQIQKDLSHETNDEPINIEAYQKIVNGKLSPYEMIKMSEALKLGKIVPIGYDVLAKFMRNNPQNRFGTEFVLLREEARVAGKLPEFNADFQGVDVSAEMKYWEEHFPDLLKTIRTELGVETNAFFNTISDSLPMLDNGELGPNELWNGSAYQILEIAYAIYSGRIKPKGYEFARSFLRENPGQVRPVHFVWLVAEAVKAGKREEMLREFPHAIVQMHSFIDHVNRTTRGMVGEIQEKVLSKDYNPTYLTN